MRIAERKLLELIDIYREEANGTYDLQRCAFEIASVDASMQAIRDLLRENI